MAYDDIQNQAYDTIVKQDIENFVKAVRIYEIQQGLLPVAGSVSVPNGGCSNLTRFAVGFRLTESTYRTDVDIPFIARARRMGHRRLRSPLVAVW